MTVRPSGYVVPQADGSATITARSAEGPAGTIQVTVAHFGNDPLVNFPNQIVPIFTKLGCNSGGCHGKASGQNGFKLSLLGFEPTEDYEHLVKEGRGRRLFPGCARPEPAVAQADRRGAARRRHADGSRLARLSADASLDRARHALRQRQTIRPSPASKSFPNSARWPQDGEQQLLVVAHYTRRLDRGRHPHREVRGQRSRDGRSRA